MSAFEEHCLKTLEYDDTLELISRYAATSAGVEYLRSLSPDSPQRSPSQELIEDILKARGAEVDLPMLRFESPRETLGRAAPADAVLGEEDFRLLGEMLESGARLRRLLPGKTALTCSTLAEFLQQVPDLGHLLETIRRVFGDDGEIRDRASSRLSEIRHDIGKLERRIRSRLDSLLRDDDLSQAIQEQHIAIRNNRYVVPVRRELRTRVKGVVHDQSNSGRTLFMEPSLTLEDGNELASLRLEERDEIRRILAELTDHVRASSSELLFMFRQLRRYDCMQSVGAWAWDYECTYAQWGDRILLKSARHPLLHAQFRQEGREDSLVPLDLEFPHDVSVLAVTGSNTGGKTVALKTVGLLTLLRLSGLPVPCAQNSVFRRFHTVVADIGDEQSLQQNLSTFSSHLTHIREILASAAGGETLALLDELGAGTDPTEGGALGCAVLAELAESNAVAVATTHLAAVKHYVHERPKMANACMLFNEDTLKPEYRLEMGRPGASHAMTIARGIGLPGSVLKRAEELLDGEQLHLEQILSQMDAQQQKLQENLQTSDKARERLVREQQELSNELAALRKERKKMLNQAQREAAAIVDNSRREMERILKKAGQAANDEKEELRRRVDRRKKNISKGIKATNSKPSEPIKPEDLSEGMNVWVEPMRAVGHILSVSRNRKKVKIDVNGMTVDVKSRDLGHIPEEEECGATPPPSPVAAKPRNATRAVTRLDLRGKRVDESLRELEKFLDAAALAGLVELRIIHGFGTGAIREATHAYLRECPLIKSFRQGRPEKDEGGAGVTWVSLDG